MELLAAMNIFVTEMSTEVRKSSGRAGASILSDRAVDGTSPGPHSGMLLCILGDEPRGQFDEKLHRAGAAGAGTAGAGITPYPRRVLASGVRLRNQHQRR